MVGSTGTLMSMRLVRSKLRKREETTSVNSTTIETQQTNYGQLSRSSSLGSQSFSKERNQFPISSDSGGKNEASIPGNNVNNKDHQQINFIRPNGGSVSNSWVFPPIAPTPIIYSCNNNFDVLIAANGSNGFKGFRKQFSGRFKRLVAKKTQEHTHTIPPELKPQLKTIYVY